MYLRAPASSTSGQASVWADPAIPAKHTARIDPDDHHRECQFILIHFRRHGDRRREPIPSLGWVEPAIKDMAPPFDIDLEPYQWYPEDKLGP